MTRDVYSFADEVISGLRREADNFEGGDVLVRRAPFGTFEPGHG
jgi:hypothetical protein